MEKKLSNHSENFFIPNGRKRVIITNITPVIDCGRYAAKCCVQEEFKVECDLLADGHDILTGNLIFKHQADQIEQKIPLQFLQNDRWYAVFTPEKIGNNIYCIEAWADEFSTWLRDLKIKIQANQVEKIDFLVGAEFLKNLADGLDDEIKNIFSPYIEVLKNQNELSDIKNTVFSDKLAALVKQYYQTPFKTQSDHFNLTVDRTLANFSAWYELFPRSWSSKPNEHGSFKSLLPQLNYIKEMGFDIIYLTPIHPIGESKRKGKNNSLNALPHEPGSPWAIGNQYGGHKSIHSELGTIDDFIIFEKAVRNLNMEIAMDFALQCSPDHPYLKSHPQWFKQRPDGSLQYAENPPKKYEDIYPLNFNSPDWYELWFEIKSILIFWIKLGIKIFRVDNPHTKPFVFWEWLIQEIKNEYPDVIFLSEAFTRPKIMYELAKIGFSQSYTYFTWRNNKSELIEYFRELTSKPIIDFFRPSLWPNTPDILHEYLQKGNKAAFIIRFILAATLGNNYGIYGPAFELCVNQSLEINSEEYLDSEKYEINFWDIHHQKNSLKLLISKVNQIRHKYYSAFKNFESLQFHEIDHSELICYSKISRNLKELILIIVNLDCHYEQSGWLKFTLKNHDHRQNFELTDLLSDKIYLWHGHCHFIKLNPKEMPAHIFLIKLT